MPGFHAFVYPALAALALCVLVTYRYAEAAPEKPAEPAKGKAS